MWYFSNSIVQCKIQSSIWANADVHEIAQRAVHWLMLSLRLLPGGSPSAPEPFPSQESPNKYSGCHPLQQARPKKFNLLETFVVMCDLREQSKAFKAESPAPAMGTLPLRTDGSHTDYGTIL